MKIWTSEHTFDHSWETVAQAMWQKYPNPHTQGVLATDVLKRAVTPDGMLHSNRLITTKWQMPSLAMKIVGDPGFSYARELSTVDPLKKEITMHTTNLTFKNFLSLDEYLSYTVNPANPTKTDLKKETVITVQGLPLSSYMESSLASTISSNAQKGILGMQWAIDKVKQNVTKENRNMNGKGKFEKILSCYLDYEKNNKYVCTKNGRNSREYYFV
jgi:hypothetical protein